MTVCDFSFISLLRKHPLHLHTNSNKVVRNLIVASDCVRFSAIRYCTFRRSNSVARASGGVFVQSLKFEVFRPDLLLAAIRTRYLSDIQQTSSCGAQISKMQCSSQFARFLNSAWLPPPKHSCIMSSNSSSALSFPDDNHIDTISPERVGEDWFAVFNPKVERVLDVTLIHTLTHESVVCCVRFSADGKYLATGCNRTAQIYDTKTGVKTW